MMISNYCRLCMSEDDLSNIDNFSLKAMKDEFSIDVKLNDKLSKQICEKCANFILTLIDFKKNVANVQKVLLQMLKQNPVSNDENPGNKSSKQPSNPVKQKQDEVIELNSEDAHESEMITNLIKSMDFSKIKIKKDLKWSKDGVYCDVCRKNIRSEEEFYKHCQSTKHVFKTKIIKNFKNVDNIHDYYCGYTCKKCSQVFTNKKQIASHSSKIHNDPIKNRDSLQPDTLVRKNKHANESRLENIPQSTNQPEKIQIKTEPGISENDGKKYGCKLCSHSFGFMESYIRHLQRHHPDVFVCTKCSFISSSRRNFTTHLRSHYSLTATQQFCSICFKVCDDRKELLNHRIRFHLPENFSCTLCSEKFSSISAVKEHKRLQHYKEDLIGNIVIKRPHCCGKCFRKFHTSVALANHECSAKKFICSKCGKRYEFELNMQKHKQKCTGENVVHVCGGCKRQLSTEHSLKRHEQVCKEVKFVKSIKFKRELPATKKSPVIEKSSVIKISAPTKKKKSKKMLCKKCRRVFVSLTELEAHHANCNEVRTPDGIECSCGAFFRDAKVLQIHKIIDHKEKGSVSKILIPTAAESSSDIESDDDKPQISKNISQNKSTLVEQKSSSTGSVTSHLDKTSLDKEQSDTIQTASPNSNQSKNLPEKKIPVVSNPTNSVQREESNLLENAPSTSNNCINYTQKNKSAQLVKNSFQHNSKMHAPKTKNKSISMKPTSNHNRKNIYYANEPKKVKKKMKKESKFEKNYNRKKNVEGQVLFKRKKDLKGQRKKNKQNSQKHVASCMACGVVFYDEVFLLRHKCSEEPTFETIETVSEPAERANAVERVSSERFNVPANTSKNDASQTADSESKSNSTVNPPNLNRDQDRYSEGTSRDTNSFYTSTPNQTSQTEPAIKLETCDVPDQHTSTPLYNDRNQNFRQQYQNNSRNERSFNNSSGSNWGSVKYSRHLQQHYNQNYDYRNNQRSNFPNQFYRQRYNSNEYDTDGNRRQKHRFSSDKSDEPAPKQSKRDPPKNLSLSWNRSKNEVSVIPHVNTEMCKICKKSDVHLFCNDCEKCFANNQSQYFNHLKMKHS